MKIRMIAATSALLFSSIAGLGAEENHWPEAVAMCRHTVWADAASRRYCANVIAEHGGPKGSPLPPHEPKMIEPSKTEVIDLGPADYPSTGPHRCEIQRCWDFGSHSWCQTKIFVSAGPC